MSKLYEEISDAELEAIVNAINQRYGIDFTNYEKKSLKRGFGRIIGRYKMTNILALWGKIMSDKEFMYRCIDDLTVNLTELFRNPEIWHTIANVIVEKFGNKPMLKIWHAGCSSGEEVYTMSIVLDQIKMLDKTRLLATDLSNDILEKAKKGEYSNTILPKYQKNLNDYKNLNFKNYFNLNESTFIFNDIFKKSISFKQNNLVTEPINEKFDIIFCRNVMIYFDEALKLKVLASLHNALNDGGYLIIGFYDNMPIDSKNLFTIFDSKAKIFIKNTGTYEPKPIEDSARRRLQEYLNRQNK